jgi:hypothetical protein
MQSDFGGMSFAGSTELSRLFYFGKCKEWTLRPYFGLDLAAVFANRASEYADNDETYQIGDGENYLASDLLALDYYSAKNTRIYGRPGIMLERGGSNGNIRMGVSYSFLMGGHRYTSVTNQFQFGGNEFNIRGVDDGCGFVTGKVGLAGYLGKQKRSMIFADYGVLAGSHSTTHALQAGYQKTY